MAITLISEPQSVEYGYNPFYYVATSTNSTKYSFKLVCDLYVGVYSPTTYVGRFRLPVRSDGNIIFSPSRILESYFVSTFNPDITSATTVDTSQYVYKVAFGEEYDASTILSATTGTTIYSGLTVNSGKRALSAVKVYEDSSSLSGYTYAYSGNTTPKFLTDWITSNYKTIFRSEYETTGFYTTDQPTSIYVQTFDLGGNALSSWHITGSFTGSGLKYSIPTGTANLGIGNSAHKYHVTMYSGGTPISQTFKYQVDDRTQRFEKIRLAWDNSKSDFDYFTFNMIRRRTLNRSNTEWERSLPYNYQKGDRQRTILGIDSSEGFTVTSDWLNDTEASFLEYLFYGSLDCYLVLSDGSFLPLVMTAKKLDPKTTDTDIIYQYTFEFEYAFRKNTKRT